jgi:hypothetical protein
MKDSENFLPGITYQIYLNCDLFGRKALLILGVFFLVNSVVIHILPLYVVVPLAC